MPAGPRRAEASTLAGRPRVSPCSTSIATVCAPVVVEQVGGQAAGAVGVGDVLVDTDRRREHPRRTRSVAHRRSVHETAEEPVPLARRCQPAEVWADSEQRRPVVDRYQHAWCAGRGDPWRVGRMRIVRGEPERGDDRGALVRCRVTQRDEALVEPHLDAGGAADRDGVERAPADVLAVVQLAQRGAGQPDGLRGNGAVAAAGQFGGGGEEPDRPATVRRPPRAEERRVRGASRSSDRTPVRVGA